MADPAAVTPDPEPAARLADALMKVSVLDSVAVRRMCVVEAVTRLGVRVSVPEFEEKKIHVVSMVRAFGAVDQGWRHLTDAVRFLADYDLPSRHAASLAHPTVAPLLDDPDQRELADLLGGLDRTTVPRLADIYLAAAGAHFGALPAGVHTAWDAYHLLEQCNTPPEGAPRALRFLQGLATVLTPDRGDRLRRWINRRIRVPAVDGPAAQRTVQDTRDHAAAWRRRPEHPAYLLFRLRPSTSAPDDVHLTFWTNTGEAWEPRCRDDRSLPLSGARQHVAALVDREEARLRSHRGGIVLEFILPVPLLNEPVEEWTRLGAFTEHAWGGDDPAGPGEPAGPPFWHDYQVVVRSLERMEALQLHRVWNERWEAFADGGARPRAHRRAHGEPPRGHGLYARLKQEPDVVLMALGAPPDEEQGRHELLTALRAGLPVCVWDHGGALGAHVHDAADAALEEERSACFDRLLRLRFAPREGDDEASCVAVLWDDPNRLPEIPEPIF